MYKFFIKKILLVSICLVNSVFLTAMRERSVNVCTDARGFPKILPCPLPKSEGRSVTVSDVIMEIPDDIGDCAYSAANSRSSSPVVAAGVAREEDLDLVEDRTGVSKSERLLLNTMLSNAAQFFPYGEMVMSSLFSAAIFKIALAEFTVKAEASLAAARWPLGDRALTLRDVSDAQQWAGCELGAHVRKIMVPVGSEIICLGDQHGHMQGFAQVILELQRLGYLDKDLRLIRDDTYIMFLGDLVDYGNYSIEALLFALKLYQINSDTGRVIINRGNHESVDVCAQFIREIACRASASVAELRDIISLLRVVYGFLPFATFVGIEDRPDLGFAQFAHGSVDLAMRSFVREFLFDDNVTAARLNEPYFFDSGNNSCNLLWGDVSGLNGSAMNRQQRYGRNRNADGTYTEDPHCCFIGLDELAEFADVTNTRLYIRGHSDQLDPVKFSVPGIHLPIYPHLNRYRERDWVNVSYSSQELAHLGQLDNGFLTQDNLWNLGFTVDEFKTTYNAPVCVVTCSNAGATKGLGDNGFCIVTVRDTWEDSLISGRIMAIR